MEIKTKLLTIGIAITLALAMSGTYYFSQDDDAFYCESRDMVMICEKLSSGLGTRCYFNETYKVCKEGWKIFENLEQNLSDFICDNKEFIKECKNEQGEIILRIKS